MRDSVPMHMPYMICAKGSERAAYQTQLMHQATVNKGREHHVATVPQAYLSLLRQHAALHRCFADNAGLKENVSDDLQSAIVCC